MNGYNSTDPTISVPSLPTKPWISVKVPKNVVHGGW
jgi:hypothetical protein